MATDLVKVLHLLMLSFSWGMQVWVSFIAAFALRWQVPLQTFSLVQRKLMPVYFYCLLGSSVVILAVFAVYHTRELQSLQMALCFVSVITAGLNTWWFGPTGIKAWSQMSEVLKENQTDPVSLKEAYLNLSKQDPKIGAYIGTFRLYHGLANLCNLIGFICTAVHLSYTALNLSTV